MNRKNNVVFSMIFILSMFSTFLLSTVTLHAADDNNINSLVLPERVIYYGGHTYAQFNIPNAQWAFQRDFCVELGKKSDVPAHLVYIKDAGIDNALNTNNMGGVIGAFESEGLWSWLDGTPIGRMVPVSLIDENGKYFWSFHYEALGYDGWCKSKHEGAENGHVTFEEREPDSFSAPACDQHYANIGADFGWHNHFEESGGFFICEFEGEVTFIIADNNYDFDNDYTTETNVHPYAPGIYTEIGGYTVPKAILKDSLKIDTNILKKQEPEQYPIHTERQYNFKGWGVQPKESIKTWNYDSKNFEMLESPQNEPTVVFYAQWERAESLPSDLECLAASMFTYAKELEKGKTVSETLKIKDNAEWKDIDNVLPNSKEDGNINMRDFIYSTIGGYVVEDYERYDTIFDTTFSAIFLKNAAGGSIIAYRGTEIIRPESVLTDIYMGGGVLNKQFDQAVDFYDKCVKENAVMMITGHSLGGALAAHTGIMRDVPRVVTVNSAQGFSIPLSLIQRHGNTNDYSLFSFITASGVNELISVFDEYNEFEDVFEDTSHTILWKYGFDKYQPKLHSYANESDEVSKPNRCNMVTEIFPEKLSDAVIAHNIDRMILYNKQSNRYSIVPTITRFPTSSSLDAEYTVSSITVNGRKVAFDAYNINGNNYFKLRDLAYVLNGTEKQFDVAWDSTKNAISLNSGKSYTIMGDEMSKKAMDVSQMVRPTTSKVYIDGKEVGLTAFSINGNNYFKLRDIGKTFDFGVDWDDESKTIVIDTGKQYIGE